MTRDDIHNKLMKTFEAMQKQGYEFTNGFAIDFEKDFIARFHPNEFSDEYIPQGIQGFGSPMKG